MDQKDLFSNPAYESNSSKSNENANLPEKSALNPPTSDQNGSIKDLFYFLSPSERRQAYAAIFLSSCQGLIPPVIMMLFTSATVSFGLTTNLEEVKKLITSSILSMIILGIVVISSSFTTCLLWNSLSVSQTKKIKTVYLRKLLYQNTEWYDAKKSEEIAATYVENVTKFGIIFSQKLNFYFIYLSQVCSGIFFCFYIGWFFTSMLVLMIPFIYIPISLYVKGVQKAETHQRKYEGKATMLLENSISLVKSIKSINGENQAIEKFNLISEKMEEYIVKSGYKNALFWGLQIFTSYLAIAITGFIGFKFIEHGIHNSNIDHIYTANDVITVTVSVLPPLVSMANISMLQKYINSGIECVNHVIKIAAEDFKETHNGYKPDKIDGDIVFENVTFSYPTNKKVKILKNVSFTIKKGEKISIIGPSGCGKTTIIQLLERFYEPEEGRITLDGIDIKEYDIKFLRFKIGLVSQHSLFFSGTVKENLVMGFEHESFSDEDFWKILEKVRAKDFVEKLPQKLETVINSSNGSMSNGQKQKLCLARALLKKPAILLFDEATNFLDKHEESEVRASIEEISSECTSILIDHKMNRVGSSDQIYVMEHGMVVENGSPRELLEKKGYYFKSITEHQEESSESDDEEHFQSKSFQSITPEAPISDRNVVCITENNDQKIGPKSHDIEISLIENVKKQNLNIWPKVYQILSQEKMKVVLIVITSIINGLVIASLAFTLSSLEINLPLFGVLMLNKFNGKDQDFDKLNLQAKIYEKRLDEAFICLFIIAITGFLISFAQLGLLTYISEFLVHNLRCLYFRKMMYLDMKYFDQPDFNSGHLALNINQNSTLLKNAICNNFGSLIQMTFSFIGGLVFCCFYSISIAIVSFFITLGIFIFKIYESKFSRYYSMLAHEMNLTVISETLGNMRLVRSLNAEETILRQFVSQSKEEKQKRFVNAIFAGFIFGMSQLINLIAYALILLFAIYFGASLNISPRDGVICFIIMAISMYGALMAHEHIAGMAMGVQALKDIVKVLLYSSNIEQDPIENTNIEKKIILTQVDKIEFRNVDFKYGSRTKYALRNLNVVFSKNQINGVFGKSASGKSAMVELLLRFYQPTGGLILLDDHPIESIDLVQLRHVFGVMSQDTRLFNDSIDSNIRGTTKLTDNEVRDLAIATNSLNFVFSSPEGFKRVLQNYGTNLSGGQRQRILLSRVLGKKSKVVFLDEPTSALDMENEKKVLEIVKNMKKDRFWIIFSSKSSPMKICDEITVLNNGRVEENGNFEELMNKKGRFYALTKQ